MKFCRQKQSSESILIKNNKGTTMLETLVAFTVLMIITGILYGIIAFCSELKISAADTNRAMETFSREIYKDNPSSEIVDVKECTKTYVKDDSTGKYKSFFYLQLSDTTDSANLPLDPQPTKEIALEDIQAKTFRYKEENYKGVVPKVIAFIHKKDWQ